MNARLRLFGFGATAAVMLLACNAILGIEDLPDPGTSADAADAATGADTSTIVDAASDTADANRAPCGEPGGADPCTIVVDPVEGGALFPTWPVTSNLPIQDVNLAVVQPVQPKYEDAGTGAVRETHTNLTWQTSHAADGGTNTFDFAGATAACQSLGAGWRVPTRIELATTQYRASVPAPGAPAASCAPPEFDQSQLYIAWTSTPVPFLVGEPANLYYQMTEMGCAFIGNDTTAPLSVRCVKGDAKPATFEVSRGNDTVYAVETGLEWERTGAVVRGFTTAKARCDAKGWRVPIIQELYGIIDPRTTGLFDKRVFVSPGGARAVISQTVASLDPDGGVPSYQAVALVNGPWGAEDGVPPDDGQADILVRCVHKR